MNLPVDEAHAGVISISGEILPPIPGACGLAVAKVLGPKPAEIRQMLRELRKRRGWSQADAAKVLGVTTSAVTKWETGAREPNGCAVRLIFALHAKVMQTSAPLEGIAVDLKPQPEGALGMINHPKLSLAPDCNKPVSCLEDVSDSDAERVRLIQVQQVLSEVIERFHQRILSLPDDERRIKPLRELSTVLAMLSAKMAESVQVSLKLRGSTGRDGLDDMGPLVPSFTPWSEIKPAPVASGSLPST